MPIEVDKLRQRTDAYRETGECEAMRKRFAGPVLLSVGRLTRTKGYHELFEIYRRLLGSRPDLALLIVGDGPEREQYERYVSQQGWTQVHFAGFVQAHDLPRYLAVADLFVFHTLSDPFGAVLSEAMAAGLPVVSSVHAGATRDLVEDGVTGFRIDPKQPESAAAAISMVLDSPPDRLAVLRRAAYDRVKPSDIEPSADRMAEFLRSLADSKVLSSVPVIGSLETPRG
jgi:glycosyltransferase involved in cell wall biosynthesis